MQFHEIYLLVCTPCYGQMITMRYFQSMIQLKEILLHQQIRHEFVTIGNESLITRARNFFVSLFLSKSEYTHLMFIDSDISFHPQSILRFLSSEKEVIGGAYPKKGVRWNQILEKMKRNADMTPTQLESQSYEYALNIMNTSYDHHSTEITVSVENGFLKVDQIATGFLMIRKSVILAMIQQYPHLKYENDIDGYFLSDSPNKDYFYSLFDCIIDPLSKRYLSEDYCFCYRWKEMKGDIWCDVSCKLTHSGSFNFHGDYLEYLKSYQKSLQ